MTDVFLLFQHGWKNIWKQKTIWFFSALPILNDLSNVLQVKRSTNFLSSLILLTTNLFFIVFFYVSFTGVSYLAYRFLIGSPATVHETLSAVRKFAGRVVGCSCLGLLVLSPLLIWALIVSTNNPTHTMEPSDKILLVLLSLSVFASLWQFTIVGFFENDWDIRESLGKAWILFKNHFGVLAILGLILAVIHQAYFALSGISTVLIQSGFDIATINSLNMLNPSTLLGKNLLFVMINGVGQTIFIPLSASIFISAYLKYNDVRLPFQMRVRQ